MNKQDWDYCTMCDGEGYYLYDSDIFYSYGSTTHKYVAQCDECYGSGKIYDQPEED